MCVCVRTEESEGIPCCGTQLMWTRSARSHKCRFPAATTDGFGCCITTATPSIFFFDGTKHRHDRAEPRPERPRMNACTMPMHLGWGGWAAERELTGSSSSLTMTAVAREAKQASRAEPIQAENSKTVPPVRCGVYNLGSCCVDDPCLTGSSSTGLYVSRGRGGHLRDRVELDRDVDVDPSIADITVTALFSAEDRQPVTILFPAAVVARIRIRGWFRSLRAPDNLREECARTGFGCSEQNREYSMQK